MDLLRDHFYKTIEEAETAFKQYSKEYYSSEFIPTNKKVYLSGIAPPPTN